MRKADLGREVPEAAQFGFATQRGVLPSVKVHTPPGRPGTIENPRRQRNVLARREPSTEQARRAQLTRARARRI
jgi:hypothetical protein